MVHESNGAASAIQTDSRRKAGEEQPESGWKTGRHRTDDSPTQTP